MKYVVTGLLLMALGTPLWAAQDLLQTYDQALGNDPRLASAQAALGAARAQYRQVRGQLLPQLGVSAGYSQVGRESGSGRQINGEQHALTLDLSQTLFDWSTWQNMDAADARGRRARVLLSAAQQALMVRTTQAYFEVLAARDALMATRERLAAIRRQLDRARAAFRAGLAPITDKQEAQSSLDAAQVDAIVAKNRLANARAALRALTGRPPRPLAGIAVHEPTTLGHESIMHSRQAWLELALQEAPSLRAAQAALTAARQEVSAARGQRYPDLALVGRVGQSKQVLSLGQTTTQDWMVGLQLEMPLFAGGSMDAAVDAAAYAAEQARLDLVATRRELRLDISSAWRTAQAAEDRVAALDQAIKSARTAVQAAKAGYRLGNRTILDVIEAETELAQRKAARKQAWYDYALARLQLRQAAGLLDQAALARINQRLTTPPTDEAPAETPA